MRLRGDLQNLGRQMNNVLLVQHPPEGLDALQQSISGILSAAQNDVQVMGELRPSAEGGMLRTALPQIAPDECGNDGHQTVRRRRSRTPRRGQCGARPAVAR